MINIIVVGVNGKMGQVICRIAEESGSAKVDCGIDVNAVGNYNELELAISQNRQLNIIYSQSDEETLEIWGISDNSATYASPEIVYDVEVKSGREGVLICWVITLCYWTFVAFFFYILEHAEKYPWIAMLLVKKDNLNI